MKKIILIALMLIAVSVQAQKQHINQTAPKDNLKQAFEKVNENFDEVYASRDSVHKVLADTIQLITNVTAYELDSLTTGSLLNMGLYYFCTDNAWFLIAVNDSVLKPVSGSLKLMNGDTLINGVEPDVLLVDFGEYEFEYNTIVPVTDYTDYIIERIIIKSISLEAYTFFVTNSDGQNIMSNNQTNSQDGRYYIINAGVSFLEYMVGEQYKDWPPYSLNANDSESNSTTLHVVIKYFRSPL